MSDTSWMLDIEKLDQEKDPADQELNSVNPPLPIPEDDPIETSIEGDFVGFTEAFFSFSSSLVARVTEDCPFFYTSKFPLFLFFSAM